MTSGPGKRALASLRSSVETGWLRQGLEFLFATAPYGGGIASTLASRRLTACIERLDERLRLVEDSHRSVEELEDLLQRAALSATRTASDDHARRLGQALATVSIADLSYQDAVRVLDDVEALTDFDICVLLEFERQPQKRSALLDIHETLCKSTLSDCRGVQESVSILNTAAQKLVSRGLLVADGLGGMVSRQTSGDPNHWTKQTLDQGYAVTSTALVLLQLLKEDLGSPTTSVPGHEGNPSFNALRAAAQSMGLVDEACERCNGHGARVLAGNLETECDVCHGPGRVWVLPGGASGVVKTDTSLWEEYHARVDS